MDLVIDGRCDALEAWVEDADELSGWVVSSVVSIIAMDGEGGLTPVPSAVAPFCWSTNESWMRLRVSRSPNAAVSNCGCLTFKFCRSRLIFGWSVRNEIPTVVLTSVFGLSHSVLSSGRVGTTRCKTYESVGFSCGVAVIVFVDVVMTFPRSTTPPFTSISPLRLPSNATTVLFAAARLPPMSTIAWLTPATPAAWRLCKREDLLLGRTFGRALVKASSVTAVEVAVRLRKIRANLIANIAVS